MPAMDHGAPCVYNSADDEPARSPYGFRSSPAYWGLGWHLIYPSWRDGFRHGLADTPPSANPAE